MRHKKNRKYNLSASNVTSNVSRATPNTKQQDVKILPFTMDFLKLHLRCKATVDELMNELGGVSSWASYDPSDNIVEGTLESYAFKDNGSNILCVAHCDTLHSDSGVYPVKLPSETLVFCQKCDDRLGVYTILDLLPSLGVNMDILLTMNEERGQSTARLFKTDKKYDWIVEFDRNGMDAVTYSYGDKEWHDVLEEYFIVNHGSFSDISDLQHLHCKAFNVGVGYHDEHNLRSFFVLEEYRQQISRFIAFYDKHRNSHFTHEKREIPTYMSQGGFWNAYGYGWGNRMYDDDYLYTPKTMPSLARTERDVLKDCEYAHYCKVCDEWFYEEDTITTVEGSECPYCGLVVKDDTAIRAKQIAELRAKIEALKYRSGSNKKESYPNVERLAELAHPEELEFDKENDDEA